MSLATSAFAVIELPRGSVLSFDGQSVVVKRDDFIGFSPIPTDGRFHLITVRARTAASESDNLDPNSSTATTVGFCICSREKLAIIRRYDPTTEEVSSTPVDEITTRNLVRQIQDYSIGPERIVPYDKFVPQEHVAWWSELTDFVSERLLNKRGIKSGMKLVAGAFEEWEDKTLSKSIPKNETRGIVDGESVSYPCIPVIEPSGGGHHHSRHVGTKRFMAKLSATQRTALFTDANPSNCVLELVMNGYYDNQWEDLLGDIQLAYVFFSFLHCFASLCHWRDLVAMLSTVDFEEAAKRPQLYSNFLKVMTSQLQTVDQDFFDDVQFSDDNFLVPSLKRLISTLDHVVDQDITPALSRFRRLVIGRFPGQFEDEGTDPNHNVEASMEQDDDDEDGPVVVSTDEVEASLARSKAATKGAITEEYPEEIRHRYPLLFAAMTPNEDVIMTCARALDDANDVSLVREAAAYLEEVEAHR